jgi:predicted MFS family arabinose efflux permease
MVFLNDFLQSQGLTKPAATLVTLSYGAGGALGSILAGVVGQRLYNWRKGALPVLAGSAVWLGMPSLYALVNAETLLHWSLAALVAFMVAGGVLASVAGVIVRPLVMNVNVPESRGVALALQVRASLHYGQ